MFDWILQHRAELTAIAWFGNLLICAPLVYMAFNTWRYHTRFRRQMAINAYLQGRYAVFDSHVRSGGANTVLSTSIKEQLMAQYNGQAEKNGEQYLKEYVRGVKDARADLSRLLYSVELPTKGDDDEQG